MLDRIRVVMVNTSHAGNIGSAARAMKTMGLSSLWLVDPEDYPNGRAKADAMASGATDLLAEARVVATLDEALAGCVLVIGASARSRTVPWPWLDAERAAGTLLAQAQASGQDVAILFGRENSGLTNEELARCHFHTGIPANPEYPVLNVASAIQVICYELRRQWLAQQDRPVAATGNAEPQMQVESVRWDKPPATADDLERFFAHLEQTLLDLRFFVVDDPRQLLIRLRRLYLRARPDEVELRILRGVLAATQRAARSAGETPTRGD